MSGVAIGTSGPGATNLVTAITNAHMDSVPTLFLTGNVIRALIGRDGFQEADITGITMPTVKHNYLVMRASDIAPTIAEAAFLATTGRKGAVHVDIPKDVFIEEAEFNWPETISIRGYRVPGEADPEEVREAASIINNAERPVIFAGHGVIQADAAEDLRKFAEKGGIPILNTLLGLGSIPPEHALSYGMMGMHGSFWANHTASAADVIIALGMRMDDRALGRFQDMNPNATIIHVDIDPAEHGKNLPTAHPIVGDLAQVLPQLVEAIEPRTHVEWIRWIDNLRNEHRHSMSVPSGSELTQQYAISKIAEFAGPEAVLTTGVGQHQMWSA